MNVGTVFEEDGVYKILVKLGDDGWPQTKRYISVSEMLGDLQSIGLPFEELVDFCFCGLQSKGRLAQLPGRTEDWSAYLGQGLSLVVLHCFFQVPRPVTDTIFHIVSSLIKRIHRFDN